MGDELVQSRFERVGDEKTSYGEYSEAGQKRIHKSNTKMNWKSRKKDFVHWRTYKCEVEKYDSLLFPTPVFLIRLL